MEQQQPIVLRTLLRADIHQRLTEFAQTYRTGYVNKNGEQPWDYGVAIQVLLDFYEHNVRTAQLNELLDKMDYVITSLPPSQSLPVESEKKDETEPELLGDYWRGKNK